MKRLLLAEPDAATSRTIQRACRDIVSVTACADFQGARARLLDSPPDLLVTNLRLDDYNGLHLILLVKSAGAGTRCIVHTDRPDLYLIREAQAIGAYFEMTDRLPPAMLAYVHAPLPDRDRRDARRIDRRTGFRGGRRAADISVSV